MTTDDGGTRRRRLADRDPDAHRPILVVDDDELILSLVTRVLRLEGFAVLPASGGREALRVAFGQAPSPRLLVTDVEMPAMSGIELAARVTADRPDLRVILMTGDPETRDEAARRPELVAAVLMKPFEVDALLAIVADVLGIAADPVDCSPASDR